MLQKILSQVFTNIKQHGTTRYFQITRLSVKECRIIFYFRLCMWGLKAYHSSMNTLTLNIKWRKKMSFFAHPFIRNLYTIRIPSFQVSFNCSKIMDRCCFKKYAGTFKCGLCPSY